MEFEEHEEEMGMGGGGGASYVDESLANPSRVKMPSPVAEEPMMVLRNNSFKGWYRECLKNHAVGIGGHALDGCCEFMAAGAEGTIDALKCAACNCHRNFHRKEIPPPPAAAVVAADPFHPFHHRRHQPPQFAACYRTPAGYLHVTGPPRGAAAPAALALPSTSGAAGGAVGGAHSPGGEDHEDHENGGGSSSKKRFRTKFTQEQKEKMLVLAERLGWRMQKHDEGLVQEFCNETGVKRQVLKVWMHNNKHTLGKKP